MSFTQTQVKHIVGTAVPLNRHIVDTDQIIPARFLKGTSKTGLGEKLFYDLRYHSDQSLRTDFPLNDARYGGKILVSGHNFGCGSSREHAPWALKDYGFEAIIAISFADIFKNNALKNQLLPVALPEETVQKLHDALVETPDLRLEIDLPAQTVQIAGIGKLSFEVDPYRKQCLLEGLDDIGYTLQHLSSIEAYEARNPQGAFLS